MYKYIVFVLFVVCFFSLFNLSAANNYDHAVLPNPTIDGCSDSIFNCASSSSKLNSAYIGNVVTIDSIGIFKDSFLADTTAHQTKIKKRKKIITAIFAFSLPFGFVGAHRVILGCKPWVPVVYIATFGGCFGILPLIDFCAIVWNKDITKYENNENVFMLLKD